uniref:Uncharacterized protein n=1 Tax=Burkholderia cenocepacia TaxID=95486 RepID=A0A071M5U5_9BURK
MLIDITHGHTGFGEDFRLTLCPYNRTDHGAQVFADRLISAQHDHVTKVIRHHVVDMRIRGESWPNQMRPRIFGRTPRLRLATTQFT